MQAMKLCRFEKPKEGVRIGLVIGDSTLLDLTTAGVREMSTVLEADDPLGELQRLTKQGPPQLATVEVKLLAPVERQEIWAAGVTYLRSKTARMEESDFSANAYDRVYSAERPELFFKSLAEKVVGPGEPVGIRRDSTWSVPEPELALVINSRGSIIGYSVGNDMSSRDIEGENLLYLPQAKVYARSCALGPWITLGAPANTVREWKIQMTIQRGGQIVFQGDTSVSQIKRDCAELAHYLFRSQVFPQGAVLLTGTGIVPPDSFTLHADDVIEIAISGVGSLRNPVAVV